MLLQVVLTSVIGIVCFVHQMDHHSLTFQISVLIDNNSAASLTTVYTVLVVLVFGSFLNIHQLRVVAVGVIIHFKLYSMDLLLGEIIVVSNRLCQVQHKYEMLLSSIIMTRAFDALRALIIKLSISSIFVVHSTTKIQVHL